MPTVHEGSVRVRAQIPSPDALTEKTFREFAQQATGHVHISSSQGAFQQRAPYSGPPEMIRQGIPPCHEPLDRDPLRDCYTCPVCKFEISTMLIRMGHIEGIAGMHASHAQRTQRVQMMQEAKMAQKQVRGDIIRSIMDEAVPGWQVD